MRAILAVIGLVAFVVGVTLPEVFEIRLLPEALKVRDIALDSGIVSAAVALLAILSVAFLSMRRK